MGERFKQNLERIKELKSNAAKALLTFFGVRGKKVLTFLLLFTNRIY